MQPMTMQSQLLSVTFTLTFALLVEMVTCFKRGPPVNDYPEICGNMSPIEGHVVDPLNRTAPFALIIESPSGGCYRHNSPTFVKLESIGNKTYFEGFFVQARLQSSAGNPLRLDDVILDGTFDPNGDRQLQALTCGNSTSRNNSLGHSQAKRYYSKTFKWTPSSTVTADIQFVATVVHEKDEYWLRVTSQTLRHNERCGQAASQSTRPLFPGTLALALSVAFSLLLIPVRGSR